MQSMDQSAFTISRVVASDSDSPVQLFRGKKESKKEKRPGGGCSSIRTKRKKLNNLQGQLG